MTWLYQFDLNLFRYIHVTLHRSALDPVFLALTFTGLGAFPTVAGLLLLLKKDWRRFLVPYWLLLLVSGVAFADVIKLFVFRDRPSNLALAHPLEHTLNSHSFPSGHSTTAFAIATALLLCGIRMNGPRWPGIIAIIWAFLVGISRIYVGVHWPTDVFAGALIGIFTAFLFDYVLTVRGFYTANSRDLKRNPEAQQEIL